MVVSTVNKTDDGQGIAPAALPKVNVRPSTAKDVSDKVTPISDAVAESSQREGARDVSVSPAKPKSRSEWDVKFAVALILLVVLVNTSLSLMLGSGGEEEAGEFSFYNEDAAPALQTGVLPQEQSEEEADFRRQTEVYVSSEDKRILLRQLNEETIAVQDEEPAVQPTINEDPDSREDILSIINNEP